MAVSAGAAAVGREMDCGSALGIRQPNGAIGERGRLDADPMGRGLGARRGKLPAWWVAESAAGRTARQRAHAGLDVAGSSAAASLTSWPTWSGASWSRSLSAASGAPVDRLRLPKPRLIVGATRRPSAPPPTVATRASAYRPPSPLGLRSDCGPRISLAPGVLMPTSFHGFDGNLLRPSLRPSHGPAAAPMRPPPPSRLAQRFLHHPRREGASLQGTGATGCQLPRGEAADVFLPLRSTTQVPRPTALALRVLHGNLSPAALSDLSACPRGGTVAARRVPFFRTPASRGQGSPAPASQPPAAALPIALGHSLSRCFRALIRA